MTLTGLFNNFRATSSSQMRKVAVTVAIACPPTPLGHQILDHWRSHRPKMVENLERTNHLQQAIFAAQELTGNLLYELTVVQKIEYHRAWEIATMEQDEASGGSGAVSRAGGCVQQDQARIQAIIPLR